MSYSNIITNIKQHVKLSPADEELIIAQLQPKRIAKKEYLLRTGDVCLYDYYVNSGCLKVCYTNEKGTECVINLLLKIGGWLI